MPALHEHIQIDDAADVITIYGIRYSGELFRGLGFDLRPDQSFQIVKREDGVITIKVTRESAGGQG
jgi:hypothetical protein